MFRRNTISRIQKLNFFKPEHELIQLKKFLVYPMCGKNIKKISMIKNSYPGATPKKINTIFL